MKPFGKVEFLLVIVITIIIVLVGAEYNYFEQESLMNNDIKTTHIDEGGRLFKWSKVSKTMEILEDSGEWSERGSYSGSLRLIADQERIAELENQWISVEDRLPETFQRVLALTKDYDLDPIHTLVHFNGAKTGFLSVGGKKDKNVTHWMPLPAPPKEQGE